eukprot:6196054-Pleurochrysis_carterae.AAC.1
MNLYQNQSKTILPFCLRPQSSPQLGQLALARSQPALRVAHARTPSPRKKESHAFPHRATWSHASHVSHESPTPHSIAPPSPTPHSSSLVSRLRRGRLRRHRRHLERDAVGHGYRQREVSHAPATRSVPHEHAARTAAAQTRVR